jgi:hypothetical protein
MSVKVKVFERERYFDKIYLCFEILKCDIMIIIILENTRKSSTKVETIFEKTIYLATQYYQIISDLKMNNFNDEGREFIQDFLCESPFW